ncbi:hypothetical protein PPERSA_10806 [Pseudocohnilembus persalinus]|uniref:Uncharacterized protein n=1 Tax=Pseudocohnilembus persalinus TaxID=266149 RepID=A0A0V0QDM8_PSEPJ|nr:hypothetical protein PPERSA_10806 [Pseudocohnilembus persalinus]|eukprot:KRX00307.1 hypothetical protein PPERSA_10806 [Pseudocohnilembus persalinus]
MMEENSDVRRRTLNTNSLRLRKKLLEQSSSNKEQVHQPFYYRANRFEQKEFRKLLKIKRKKYKESTPEYKGKKYLIYKEENEQQINVRHMAYVPDNLYYKEHFRYYDNMYLDPIQQAKMIQDELQNQVQIKKQGLLQQLVGSDDENQNGNDEEYNNDNSQQYSRNYLKDGNQFKEIDLNDKEEKMKGNQQKSLWGRDNANQKKQEKINKQNKQKSIFKKQKTANIIETQGKVLNIKRQSKSLNDKKKDEVNQKWNQLYNKNKDKEQQIKNSEPTQNVNQLQSQQKKLKSQINFGKYKEDKLNINGISFESENGEQSQAQKNKQKLEQEKNKVQLAEVQESQNELSFSIPKQQNENNLLGETNQKNQANNKNENYNENKIKNESQVFDDVDLKSLSETPIKKKGKKKAHFSIENNSDDSIKNKKSEKPKEISIENDEEKQQVELKNENLILQNRNNSQKPDIQEQNQLQKQGSFKNHKLLPILRNKVSDGTVSNEQNNEKQKSLSLEPIKQNTNHVINSSTLNQNYIFSNNKEDVKININSNSNFNDVKQLERELNQVANLSNNQIKKEQENGCLNNDTSVFSVQGSQNNQIKHLKENSLLNSEEDQIIEDIKKKNGFKSDSEAEGYFKKFLAGVDSSEDKKQENGKNSESFDFDQNCLKTKSQQIYPTHFENRKNYQSDGEFDELGFPNRDALSANLKQIQKQKFGSHQKVKINQDGFSNNLVIVQGLEDPHLIKNILRQFVNVDSEEILNGWVEDIIDTESRPTLNDIDSTCLYITVKHIYIRNRFDIKVWEQNKVNNVDVNYVGQKHMSFVIGKNQHNKMYLLIFLEDSLQKNNHFILRHIDEIFEQITKKDKRYYYQPMDTILFRLIDKIIEKYHSTLATFDMEIIKDIDNQVIMDNPDPMTLKKIHIAKQECLEMKYVIQPLKEILKKIVKRNNLYHEDANQYLSSRFDNNMTLQRQQSKFQRIIIIYIYPMLVIQRTIQ